MNPDMPEEDDYYVAVPVELHAELVEGDDATARSAPGVRVDVGAAVDAVRVALEVGSGLTTVIVGAAQLKAFSSRLVRALKRRGVDRVFVDTSEGGPSVVDVSDEELYRELLKRLATPPDPSGPPAPPTPPED